jgi:DNA polymerase III alpha subunit
MRLDKFSNPVFDEFDIFDAIYQGKLATIKDLTVDPSDEIANLETTAEIQFTRYNPDLESIDIKEFDQALQSDWFMPDKYKTLDIEEWLLDSCPEQNHQRLIEELQEYKSRNMLDLLRWLKYFVDTMEKNNIVRGVGRGSSVASYVLYLLGVHQIDSMKYNLDWREFLR